MMDSLYNLFSMIFLNPFFWGGFLFRAFTSLLKRFYKKRKQA